MVISPQSRRCVVLVLLLAAFLLVVGRSTATATATATEDKSPESAPWIWSPQHQQGEVPHGPVFFRKSFSVTQPISGQIGIAADDRYELFVNGKQVAEGAAWRRLDQHDLSQHLVAGKNVVAVRVMNEENAYAGLAVHITIQQPTEELTIVTDRSWRSNVTPLPLWHLAQYNDFRWPRAALLSDAQQHESQPDAAAQESTESGESEVATKDDDDPQGLLVVKDGQQLDSFQTVDDGSIQHPDGFVVERIDCHAQTGSLIAMAFNEFGDLIVSREEGHLSVLFDANYDGTIDTIRTYCELVTNCQGILPLNGQVFVTGDGPDGKGLYRLDDSDLDGMAESATLLVAFIEDRAEHGPHGLTLGPDGMIYVVVGNHARVATDYADTSPYRYFYEGDLILPRYEDPGGHALGVKAPGGVIIRTDLEATHVERFAGGLRNPYDLAFNRAGDLFTHDADMESDQGTAWYRPTRVDHVIAGGEFGWRSGWAKWPDYYPDSLPPIADTGRGSPAGLVVYEHGQFPALYHDTLFSCDWSEGRILAIHLQPDGASYVTETEEFLSGRPLNAVDIEVGPDGGLYVITGGRGTKTFLYRISYHGVGTRVPVAHDSQLIAALHQVQAGSAWGRQTIAEVQHALGDRWETEIVEFAQDDQRNPDDRAAALRIMGWYGPRPTPSLLINLSRHDNTTLRSAATSLLGEADRSDEIKERLIELTADGEAHVRRRALDALRNASYDVPVARLEKLLATTDRFESTAARQYLLSRPVTAWQDEALKSENPRYFLQLALAEVTKAPDKQRAAAIVARLTEFLSGFLTDRDFGDLIRLCQVALLQNEITASDMPRLGEILAEEFPAQDNLLNRELIRLLAYLQESSIKHRYLSYLEEDIDDAQRLHVVAHLRALSPLWNTDDKVKLLRAIHASTDDDSVPIPAYVQNIGRDLAALLTARERRIVLAGGAVYPEAALAVLFELPAELTPANIDDLKILDRRLIGVEGPSADRLRIGIVAVLARSGSPEATAYLRNVYDRDVGRRAAIAIGLAQQPAGENWPYLIKSLPHLDDAARHEILAVIRNVDEVPSTADLIHPVVSCLDSPSNETAEAAIDLLEQWQQITPRDQDVTLAQAKGRWRTWYGETFPAGPALGHATDVPMSEAQHELEDLVGYIDAQQVTPDLIAAGAVIYQEAQCAKCHRFGRIGEVMGPDLTQIGRRFDTRDILDSILNPSRVISGQYAARTVVDTDGRSHTGIVGSGGPTSLVVLKSDGTKVNIPRDEVEEIVASDVSAMPAGLLKELSREQIRSLIGYLKNPPAQRVGPVATRPRRFGQR